MNRRKSKRLDYSSLETRQLLATIAFDDVLQESRSFPSSFEASRAIIEGTEGDDTLVIDVFEDRVQFWDGTDVTVAEVPFFDQFVEGPGVEGDFQVVRVNTLGGDDLVVINYHTPAIVESVISLGSGDDVFIEQNANDGVVVFGGDGNDRITFNGQADNGVFGASTPDLVRIGNGFLRTAFGGDGDLSLIHI